MKISSLIVFLCCLLVSVNTSAHLHPASEEPKGEDMLNKKINEILKKMKNDNFSFENYSFHDRFIGVRNYGNGFVAEFRYGMPKPRTDRNGKTYLETHFRLNLRSLLTIMKNTMKRPNYRPEMLIEEQKALDAIVDAILGKIPEY